MKRITALIIVLSLSLLCACEMNNNAGENEESSGYTKDDLGSYDNESLFIPPAETSGSTTPEASTDVNEDISAPDNTEPTGGFMIKDKKYSYEGTDLVILDVENQTDKNYTITINGSYLDKDGNVIKTETQTFEGFCAGMQNYFLFQPKITFDIFTYTVEMVEYKEECLMSYFKLLDAKLTLKYSSANFINGDRNLYPTIFASLHEYNSHSEMLVLYKNVIVIDQYDRIYTIQYRFNTIAPQNETQGWADYELYYELTDGEITWPDELEGDVKILLSVIKIDFFTGME